MSNILTIAYSVEGSTDKRFLENIVQRTFEDVALDCESDIDVFPLVYLPSPKQGHVIDNTLSLSKNAYDKGIQVLCIHVDADSADEQSALQSRINPAFTAVENSENLICKILVPIIPVHMTEAWMLADKKLFKEEIGTTMTNQDLGISRGPESIANPKQVIEEALRLAQENVPPKRRQTTIGILYQPLGQKISLDTLKTLKSFLQFRESVVNAFKKLNYLH